MPGVRLTKRTIDALPTPNKDTVHWDKNCPGFGLKFTPKGRKVFIVLYRTADGRLRKFTIGPSAGDAASGKVGRPAHICCAAGETRPRC